MDALEKGYYSQENIIIPQQIEKCAIKNYLFIKRSFGANKG